MFLKNTNHARIADLLESLLNRILQDNATELLVAELYEHTKERCN